MTASRRSAPAPKPGAVGGSPKGKTSVDVVDGDGAYIRTYSKREHGAKFLDYANEFASKREGRKVVATKGAKDEDEEEGE